VDHLGLLALLAKQDHQGHLEAEAKMEASELLVLQDLLEGLVQQDHVVRLELTDHLGQLEKMALW